MVCPYCGQPTQVTNSRHKRRTNIVWRRRRCQSCASIISTEETVRYDRALVVRTDDGRLQPFWRDKLLISLYKSLAHRPTAATDAAALTETVLASLRSGQAEPIIDVASLTDCASRALGRFDELAGRHYQAYHAVSNT